MELSSRASFLGKFFSYVPELNFFNLKLTFMQGNQIVASLIDFYNLAIFIYNIPAENEA
jgi:hypothetical protein